MLEERMNQIIELGKQVTALRLDYEAKEKAAKDAKDKLDKASTILMGKTDDLAGDILNGCYAGETLPPLP
jgi:hypothetical protein